MARCLAIAIAALLIMLPPPAPAQDAAKRADIERLMELAGTTAVIKQMASVMVPQITQLIRQMRPEITAEQMTILEDEVEKEFANSAPIFITRFVPIYDQYFSHDEIKEMLVFLASPVGRKMTRTQPALMAEGAAIGQQWAKIAGQRVMERVKRKMAEMGL